MSLCCTVGDKMLTVVFKSAVKNKGKINEKREFLYTKLILVLGVTLKQITVDTKNVD